MWFALLGPLVFVDDADREVLVSGARQRILLAALLLHANLPVSRDALAEVVWGGSPPSGAPATLRSHIRRLRRALGSVAGARITARQPGYLIRVDEPELDVLRFEALCRKASAALRTGEWNEAAAVTARALALWRAAPLLDVPSQALHQQFVPLFEQLRVQALEDQIEAELHMGEHQKMVPQLLTLTSQYPLHERFHAQLMLALVRSGRHAEALEAYQTARRGIVAELGIEPGAALRRLQQRVLAGDIELTAPRPTHHTPRPGRAGVPRQLPAGVHRFTGRQTELDFLISLADESESGASGTVVISAINGMAGIGKTALAVHAAHQLTQRFPDGQLFIDLHGYTQDYPPRSAGEALESFLRSLGVPPPQIPHDLEERAALYRQQLADTRTLILLDNAATEAQVRPLVPGTAGCLVLITSRRRLKGLYDAYPLTLDVLPEADALALLRAVAGPRRVPVGEPVVAEIAELCGRLPLALRIAAALLHHRPAWTLAHLATLLHDQQQRITALSDGERDLGAVFDLSYMSLPDTHQHLFRRLGLIPGPDTDTYATAALTNSDPDTATRLLEDLVDNNLLIQHTPGRYRMHDLIRTHAHTLAIRDPADQQEAALDRLLNYYQHTAHRADALLATYPRPTPSNAIAAHTPALPDPDAARAWLRAERPNIFAALQHSTHPERVIALTAVLANLLRHDGPWTRAITLHTAAITAAEQLHDRRAHATALTDRGEVWRLIGDAPRAARDLKEALNIARDTGDKDAQASALARLGEVWAWTGDLPDAIRDLEAALDIFRDTGDKRAQATTLDRLGDARALTGDLPAAIRDLMAALDIFHGTGDKRAQAVALARLGAVRAKIDDPSAAIHDLRQALQLLREVGDRRGQANALIHLGNVRRLAGDLRGAAHDLKQALDISRELGDRNGQAGALTYLGAVRRLTGDLPGATRDLKTALDIFRESGARGNENFALNHYAAVVAASGDITRAHILYHDALHLAQETQQADEQAHALEGISEYYLHVGDTQTATTHLQQALAIFQRLTMTPDVNRIQTRLTQFTNHQARDKPTH